MSGAMAGSAILAAQERRSTLGTVTLTVNNECNLSCPHCYLQYMGVNRTIDDRTLNHVFMAEFERVCIVGKEPLANSRSARIVSDIVERASRLGKSVSLITNGLNGHLLSRATLERLAWIDVSIDGGPASYRAYRKGSWGRLRRSIDIMREQGLRELRLLQTVSEDTKEYVAEMVAVGPLLGASLTIFSPFQVTRAQGPQFSTSIQPEAFVRSLLPYAADERVYMGFDSGYAESFADVQSAVALAHEAFGRRFTYVDTDPIDRGIVRITYDGLVLTPFEAVHTNDYQLKGRPALERSIEGWFELLRRPQPLH